VEVFDCEFSEIASIVGCSEVNCRQILARARKHVEARRPRFDATPEQAEMLLQQFETSLKSGAIEDLMNVLRDGRGAGIRW